MKFFLLLSCFTVLLNILFAQTKTWNGANSANWNVAGNWSPSGVPGTGDTVFFNSFNACNLDINASIASLRVSGSGGIIISASAPRILTINNNGASTPVLSVASGSFLSIGNGNGISISTYGGVTPNNAQIAGSLNLLFASSWTVNNGTFTSLTNVDISGTVNVTSIHTGTAFTNSSIATLRFLSGSNLLWARNGGNIPPADFQNGSTINLTGITSTMVTFNTSSNYNGLVLWNSTSQTISGSSAVLLPSTSSSMDSIRVVSTGTGTLRLATEPAGYTIGHVEVQGGTLELSSPVSGYRTGSITTDLKITGGNVKGNATFAGDGAVGYPMTLTVNGNFIMTGGTFDLTNRSAIAIPAGAFQLNIAGYVSQIAGTITATTAFGSQNYVSMNGVSAQNLEMSNITGPVGLVINNAAGVFLQNNLNLPTALVLISGVLSTTALKLLTMSAGSVVFGASNTSFVDGPIAKIGNTAFTFPVGKTNCGPSGTVKGYAALAIANFTGGAATDKFTAEYKRGDALGLGAITAIGLDHVSRCDYWTLTRDNGGSTVDITLSWDGTINNCVTTAVYINSLASLTIAHNNNAGATPWDAIAVAGVTSGAAAAGTVTWSGVQSSTFGAFTIGSVDFLNPLPITVNYLNGTRQNSNHLLTWKITCNSTAGATMSLERSSDGRNYNSIYTITASALRCRQPFDQTDTHPLAGVNYYRLKITDANGKVTYSSVISLINADKGFEVMNIAPNPIVNGSFKLNISAAQKMQLDIVITDMQGRQLQKQTMNLIAGFNAIDMSVKNFAKGTYQVSGNTADGISGVIRFVIQ